MDMSNEARYAVESLDHHVASAMYDECNKFEGGVIFVREGAAVMVAAMSNAVSITTFSGTTTVIGCYVPWRLARIVEAHLMHRYPDGSIV